MKLLHIDSSVLGPNSVSRQLSASIVERQKGLHLDLEVVYRDLTASPLQHLSGAHLAAAQGVEPSLPVLARDIEAGNDALEEFLAAEIVVVGAPMYNFSIPSQLKAWVDRLAIAGRTFSYTEKGPIGLVGGKRVIVASSRGGSYSEGGPTAFLDHQEAYLKAIFGFMGITDMTVIRAENVNVGPEERANALAQSAHGIAALSR